MRRELDGELHIGNLYVQAADSNVTAVIRRLRSEPAIERPSCACSLCRCFAPGHLSIG
jgi:hypothetical protein